MQSSEQSLAVVNAMIGAWRALDWGRVLALFAPNGALQLVPLRAYTGRDQIKAHLDQVATGIERLEFDIRHLHAVGPVVFFERTDDFVYQGRAASVPVMGVLEVEGEHVMAWREYMDLGTMAKAMRQ
jgi:limonene-1,2-epoxide hydrolase